MDSAVSAREKDAAYIPGWGDPADDGKLREGVSSSRRVAKDEAGEFRVVWTIHVAGGSGGSTIGGGCVIPRIGRAQAVQSIHPASKVLPGVSGERRGGHGGNGRCVKSNSRIAHDLDRD